MEEAKNRCAYTEEAAKIIGAYLIDPFDKHYADNKIPCYAFSVQNQLFHFGEHLKHPEYLEVVHLDKDDKQSYKVNIPSEEVVKGNFSAEHIAKEFMRSIKEMKSVSTKGKGVKITTCYYCEYPIVNPPIHGQCQSCNSRNILHYKTGQDT